MFVLRGIAVSLTFFILVYSAFSLLVVCGWHAVQFRRAIWASACSIGFASRRASVLFWMRVSPLLVSAAVTLGLVVPAYVWLEPRSIEEDIALPVVLAVACLLLFAMGATRAVIAHQKSSRMVADWLLGANLLDAGIGAPAVQGTRAAPPLTLVGVCAPRVVVSESTIAILSQEELRVAVQHEVAHMRARDNLKKLIFHCSPFPGMGSLETAWHDAAEFAADDCAVSDAGEAVDLASALIKLSRILPAQSSPAFTMALVNGASSLSLRVSRLLAWSQPSTGKSPMWGNALLPAVGVLLVAVVSEGAILMQIHRITEWLVR